MYISTKKEAIPKLEITSFSFTINMKNVKFGFVRYVLVPFYI